MSERIDTSQKDVWDFRARKEVWPEWGFSEPLSPSKEELEYQQSLLLPGGKVLVLGATPGLCEVASEVTESVTAVDFSENAIKQFAIDGVKYKLDDWITFLESAAEPYDAIVTDGGLTCMRFPDQWRLLGDVVYDCLKPGGIFSARIFLSNDRPPKEHYENPNLPRILPAMSRVDEEWMVVKPAQGDLAPYPARYTFPPRDVVEQFFGKFALRDVFVPGYEEGDHFVTFAFQRPESS